jgi:hypothetical protein
MAAKGEVGGEEEEDEGGGEEEEGAGRQILVELFHWIPCENRCGLWSAGVFVLQRLAAVVEWLTRPAGRWAQEAEVEGVRHWLRRWSSAAVCRSAAGRQVPAAGSTASMAHGY